MQESAKLYLQKKAKALDLARAGALEQIQKILDEHYPGQARAKSLNEGVLKVITESSVVAGELRLRQMDLIPKFIGATNRPITRLHIQITTP